MKIIEIFETVGALNPQQFVGAANDLGAGVGSLTGAAMFWAQALESEGENTVVGLLSDIPVVKMNRSPQYKSWANVWSNLGDAVVTLLGGTPEDTASLLEQNAQLQAELAQSQDEAQGPNIPVWEILGVGVGLVAIFAGGRYLWNLAK